MQSTDQLRRALASALGPDAVWSDDHALDTHRIDGLAPCLVVTPSDPDQVAAILRLCGEAQAAVYPWGGGTALALGNPPRRAGVIVRLDRLNRILDHDAANLTVSAQCGIGVNALQSALAEQNQFVPLDVPYPQLATVGGAVAANLNGPRRSRYGGVRDLVIGMKVALASGAQIKAGGKVVKNVAGYDMCKLFVGSLGTLGIITEVTLRVVPLAERAATFTVSGDLTPLEEFHQRMLRSPLLPAATCLTRGAAAKDWRIAVWCEGFDESVERQLGDLEANARHSGLSPEVLTAGKHDELWAGMRDFPLQADRLIYRVTIARAAVFEFVKMAAAWDRTDILADAAIGTIWLARAAQGGERGYFARLAAAAREHRGHAILFAAAHAWKAGINVWGASAPTLPLMRAIKRQFDPDSLLNPGRFVGDL
jgi:glycolate oxidase FAD binding subunit